MAPTTVVLVSDSDFFHKGPDRASVYDLIKTRAPRTAVYGIWERKLGAAPKIIEEIMHFVDTLGVGDVLLVLCLGQHDVLADQLDRTGWAVSRLTLLAEKYNASLLVLELFDHTEFALSQSAYAEGVATINFSWNHEAWLDTRVQCVCTRFLSDRHFLSDQMHLTTEGKELLASVIVGNIRLWNCRVFVAADCVRCLMFA